MKIQFEDADLVEMVNDFLTKKGNLSPVQIEDINVLIYSAGVPSYHRADALTLHVDLGNGKYSKN